MNKLKYIILILPALLFSACEKDTAPETTVLEIRTDDPTDYGRKSITLNGTISNIETIKEAGFLFWKTGEKEYAAEVTCEDISSHLNAVVDGLETGESYLYCLYVGNGINRMMADTKSFQTPTVGAPLVSKVELISDKTVRATINDDGIDETGKHIVAKGFCWNTTGRPTVFDQKVVVDSISFEATLSGIQSNTDYYVRAFAQNDSSYLAYGPELKINIGRKRGIYTTGDFILFRDLVNRGEDISSFMENGVVYIDNDIDLSSEKNWVPFQTCHFILDGNNHTIDNIHFTINENGNCGLFEYISNIGEIRNLTIGKNSTFVTTAVADNTGNNIGSICAMNFGKIINCHNYCNLIDNRVHIFSNIGGISGWNDAGSIEGCSNHGTISSDWQAGGISGFNEGGVISKCINHGNIRNHTYSRPSGDGAAGISYSFNGTIEDCTNYGTIEGEGAYLSGIGDCSQKSIISNCHNMGEVKGFTSIGGISASIPDGTVKNCINEGNITLTENPYGYSGDIGGISAQTGNDTEEEGNGYIINCTNKGRINGSTLFIGNITGKLERTGSISGCTYGGYVNGMPGTEMNAVGKEL